MRIFKDRSEAGKQLVDKLDKYKSKKPLILGLPRGGVMVAHEVALAFNSILDTVVSRKIASQSSPEIAVGAIAPGDVLIFDEQAIEAMRIKKTDLDDYTSNELLEMDRKMTRYRSGVYAKNFIGEIVIIIDDGVATGLTARAAVESVKLNYEPKKIIFASPICTREAVLTLESSVDEIVCIAEVSKLISISYWYQNFEQVTDDEVLLSLKLINSKDT
jgi:putative phosphoribosyl transferase